MTFLWFGGPQFPSPTIKNKNRVKKNQTVDGYKKDIKNDVKSLPTAPKKRKKPNLVKIPEREIAELYRGDGSDENDSILDYHTIIILITTPIVANGIGCHNLKI